jgi:PAS domain S-box-containing protein
MEPERGAPTVDDVLGAIPMAVVLIGADRRVTGWNPAAEVLYGHARADVLGRPAAEVLFDPDDRGLAVRRFDSLRPPQLWEGDGRVRRQDGTLLVSSFRLAAVGHEGALAWIATDGTDQGLAEQERAVLLSAEHAARATAEEALGLLEAILGSAPVGIAVFDAELRYVRVNDAYAELSGEPAEDHVGARLGEVMPLPAEVMADLRRVSTTGRTIVGRQTELVGRDGGARHFTVSYFPVRTASGLLVGAGLTAVEISQLKRAEAERAALLRRAEEAQQRLSILAAASTVLTTTMEPALLLRRLTHVLTPTTADWCVIELFGFRGEVDHAAASNRDRVAAAELERRLRLGGAATSGPGPLAEVVRTGQPRLVPADTIEELLLTAAPGPSTPVASALLVPIESHGRVLGVLLLGSEGGDGPLDDDDLDLAVEISHRAALAVGNAQAYQQERRVAETLQRALLPATLPPVPALDLGACYVAATDGASVGGDWYDVLIFGAATTGLVIGDVVGHDIGASAAMGQLRSVLRAYAYEDPSSPAGTLARVDRAADDLGSAYATCVFGILDTANLRFRWTNAGHPPPLLRRDGTATFLRDGAGQWLGVSAGSGMNDASVAVLPGDILVLYTDGLVERRGESIDCGFERLVAAVEATGADTADAFCDAVVEVMLPPGSERADDVAILVARVRPISERRAVPRLSLDTGATDAAAR